MMRRPLFRLLFDVVLLVAAVLSNEFASAAGNLVDGPNADLRYSPFSGRVVLDASDLSGQGFFRFRLSNEISGFVFGDILVYSGEFFPFLPAASVLDIADGNLQYANLSSPPTAIKDIGPIFPLGLTTASDVASFLSEARYSTSAVAGEFVDPEAPFEAFDIVIVPEPSAWVMLLLAMMALGFFPRERTLDFTRFWES